MNYRELVAALTPQHGHGEASAIVRMVMEERFGLSLADLLLGKDTQLSSHDRAEFEKIAQQLLAGVPVQHILGYADFCGHRFRVTPDVLIPRPETEELARLAIDELNPQSSIPSSPLGKSEGGFSTSILDLCTGSGCIAIALALAFPEARVTAVDVSTAALAVARENAATLGASNVRFMQGDILNVDEFRSAQSDASHLKNHQSSIINHQSPFSLLVSNPPYVRASEASEMSPTVLDHEPSLALFVPDDDPLRFYRAIGQYASRHLSHDGILVLEINEHLGYETCQLLQQLGFATTLHRDFRDKYRNITAHKTVNSQFSTLNS